MSRIQNHLYDTTNDWVSKASTIILQSQGKQFSLKNQKPLQFVPLQKSSSLRGALAPWQSRNAAYTKDLHSVSR
jgi:hypothetical protein